MAGSVNKAILVGTVGKDPEVRTTNGGQKIVSFSVATGESWTDKASGERRQTTAWHPIVIFDTKLGDIAEKYVTKGVRVYIEGQIEPRKYTTKDGDERHITEIVLKAFRGNLTLLSSPGNRSENSAPPDWSQNARPASRQGASRGPDLDDKIPFAPEFR
jgi:single-strand DNA-binding protein